MNFFRFKLREVQRGFTLIELLIVIVVLGILATAVLVAMDPVEQINRGKDAGIISSVGQLGHAVQAYYTSQSATLTVLSWNTVPSGLVTAGELKSFPSVPTGTQACSNNMMGGGFCYVVLASGIDSVVYAHVQSKSSQTKVVNLSGGTMICTPQTTWAVFYTTLGKEGLTCGTEANVIGGGLTLY